MAWLRNLGFKAGVAAWQLENIPDGVALQHSAEGEAVFPFAVLLQAGNEERHIPAVAIRIH